MNLFDCWKEIRKKAEDTTEKSFYGGGCMKYKDVLGFLDGAKKIDTVSFNTHSGWMTAEKFENEEYKIVIMLVGRKKVIK